MHLKARWDQNYYYLFSRFSTVLVLLFLKIFLLTWHGGKYNVGQSADLADCAPAGGG